MQKSYCMNYISDCPQIINEIMQLLEHVWKLIAV